MQGLVKVVVTTVALITVACSAAVLLIPPPGPDPSERRRMEAQRFMDRVAEAVDEYFRERGDLPPGDGTGSAKLVRALQIPSASGVPYFEFSGSMLSPEGHLRSPLDPEQGIVYYRRNMELRNPEAAGQDRQSFDLWCLGADGQQVAAGNWSMGVSPE